MDKINLKKLRINNDLSQEEMGKILGVTKQQVGRIESGKSVLTNENYNILLNHFGKTALIEEETVTLDFYPEVFGSCGNGAFVLSEEKEQINVPVKCFNFPFSKVKKYSVINAVGDSMQPFIYDKDKLIVEHYSGEQIKDNRVYVFCYCNEIFIKRLSKNINEIIIKSDNPDPIYRARIIEKEDMNNIIIIGEIVGLMRDLR